MWREGVVFGKVGPCWLGLSVTPCLAEFRQQRAEREGTSTNILHKFTPLNNVVITLPQLSSTLHTIYGLAIVELQNEFHQRFSDLYISTRQNG